MWVAAAASALLFATSYFLARVWPRKTDSTLPLQVFGTAALLLALCVVGLLVSSFATFVDFYLPVFFASPWAAAGVAVAGVGLYWLRSRWLHVYAALEIAGAIATSVICAFTSYGSPLARGAALLTATYFLVRGLDNAEKGKLFPRIRLYARRTGWRGALMLALVLPVALMPLYLTNPDADVAPPFLSSKEGARIPVSPMRCGSTLITCDEAAWRERERLINGTPEDRARAEADADRRLQEHEARRRQGR